MQNYIKRMLKYGNDYMLFFLAIEAGFWFAEKIRLWFEGCFLFLF